MWLNDIPGLDLNIEENSKSGRKKKAINALARNSNHWMNQILEYNDIQEPNQPTYLQPVMPSTSNNIDEAVENSIPAPLSNSGQVASSITIQPLAQKRGRGRPPKLSNVQNTDAEILQSNPTKRRKNN